MASTPVDGVVLDIGVSSMQLDEAERGFSFRADGPLDMRMGAGGADAADVVNRMAAGDLARIIRLPRRGAAGRPHRPRHRARRGAGSRSSRTLELADIVAARSGRPARQASIRRPATSRRCASSSIDELGELAAGACSPPSAC